MKPRFECDVCGANKETFHCGARGCVLLACMDCLKRHELDCLKNNGSRDPTVLRKVREKED